MIFRQPQCPSTEPIERQHRGDRLPFIPEANKQHESRKRRYKQMRSDQDWGKEPLRRSERRCPNPPVVREETRGITYCIDCRVVLARESEVHVDETAQRLMTPKICKRNKDDNEESP